MTKGQTVGVRILQAQKPPTIIIIEPLKKYKKHEGNMLQCPFEPGCFPAPTWRIPDASWWCPAVPSWIASFPYPRPVSGPATSALCPLFVVTTGDNFQERRANHKATFQLCAVRSAQLSMPPSRQSPPDFPLSPPTLYSHQLKGDIYWTSG